MKTKRNRIFKLILFLIIILSLFDSCNLNIESNKSNLEDTGSNKNLQTKIDSMLWLKSSAGIRGIFEDSKGNLWFTSTEFVSMYDGSKHTYFTENDGLDGIGMVHEDQSGTVWVEDGFKAYSYDGLRFTSHTLKPDTTGHKWDASIHDLWFQKGIPRFGDSDGPPGVYRNHDGEIEFLPFPVPKTNSDDNLYYPTTKAIHGKDGTIWFGTMEKVIGFKNGSFTVIGREEMGRKDDPGNVGIRGLYADSKGRLWMADNGSGVFVYEKDTVINFTKLHKMDKGDREGNTLHRAFSIAEDNDGNMWFGTVYNGIWRYDPDLDGIGGNSFTNYAEKQGVISDNIWTIYKTPKGELLFAGENPGAVYKFNGQGFDRVY